MRAGYLLSPLSAVGGESPAPGVPDSSMGSTSTERSAGSGAVTGTSGNGSMSDPLEAFESTWG